MGALERGGGYFPPFQCIPGAVDHLGILLHGPLDVEDTSGMAHEDAPSTVVRPIKRQKVC